jgi:hypothetical protein
MNPSLKPSDVSFVVQACVALLVLRMLLCGGIHPYLIKVPSVFRTLCKDITQARNINKIAESLWYMVWHTISFGLGFYILWVEWCATEETWIRLLVTRKETRWLWAATESEARLFSISTYPLLPPSDTVRWYYLLEFGFWLSSLLFICFETIRHDFRVLLVHHLATCSLIALSYVCCFWRIGCLVLVLHDIVDIFLYTTKFLHYTFLPKQFTDICFVMFAVVYLLARLLAYPVVCVLPSLDIWTIREITGNAVRFHWQVPGGCLLPFFLCVLQALHFFWFYLILKIMFKTLFKKVHIQGDIRSEGEEDSSDDADIQDKPHIQ